MAILSGFGAHFSKVDAFARAHPKLWHWASLIGGAVLAIVLIPIVWTASPPDKGVVAEWNESISRLGIEPVFPPEEDVYVGDVLAVIIPETGTQPQALLNRAIKLDHIDMSDDLVKNYQLLPLFPDTEKRPLSPDDPWVLKNKEEGVFAGTQKRGTLAIAAFPGITIHRDRGASAGLAGWLGSVFGASVQQNDILELKISTAETYGVPSVQATGRLALYCNDPFTKNVCSDETLRNHLSYVNREALDKVVDPATDKERYRLDVEIAFVNRVYLTRSIEQTRKLGSSQAAAIRSLTDAAAQLKRQDEQAGGAPDGAGKGQGTSAAQARTNELLQQLNSLPGGLASVYSDSDSSYQLKQTLQRPIVIGYRAVRRSFK